MSTCRIVRASPVIATTVPGQRANRQIGSARASLDGDKGNDILGRPRGARAHVRFEAVRIAASAGLLPERRVGSAELEERLAGVYARFGLSVGRLELMTGIRERRFFEPGTR